MRKTIIVAFIMHFFFSACNKSEKFDIEEFEFAVYEDAPIFSDEYMYDKEQRKAIKVSSDKLEWYLVDWNMNGIFNETGIDYYGVKSPFKQRPVCSLLEEKSYFNHNSKTYVIDEKTGFFESNITNENTTNTLNYITEFIPLELGNGTILKFDEFRKYEKTIIYFWATWCKPCLRTLEKVNNQLDSLKSEKVNFVPVYYQSSSSDVVELFQKNGYSFKPLEITDNTAIVYQINAMPTVYVFNSKGELVAENFDLD